MRKQLDPRIPILINNNVAKNHRSFIVLVGDKGRDQVVNLHYLLSQARVSARPSVLWCYKKELGFTTHRKKREAKIKRDVKRGIREVNDQNPFEIFVTVTDIRYTYYKESHKILGNTFGMCVLQDFEAITPNLLARTIETVEGGGLIVLMLKSMTSLKQLYSLTMDVHARYRTSSHDSVTPRFNERFILSLGSCQDCLFLDDELNVLPISKGKDISPYTAPANQKDADSELTELKSSLADTKPAGPLVSLAKTIDQAQAILNFIDSLSQKTLSSTVTLTAARGRGKSAALGLGIAAALAHGYSNIFVTSPSPENLSTVFGFIFKGMDALGYEEHLDYDIRQSTNPEFNKAVVRVDVFRDHRQTIQYIQPQDAHVLGQAELLVIDEAAAIPLPLVRNLFGPYLVFLASTVNGYEGTGRSLSLKLIQQLRESTAPSAVASEPTEATTTTNTSKKYKATAKARQLHELSLSTPIRYGQNDQIEKWLYNVLCLNASLSPTPLTSFRGHPHPSTCTLYHINRDTLFSFHPVSEVFLQKIVALFVASHYKNQPNDLQLMADAPGCEIFVLLPPLDEKSEGDQTLPTPLAVLQVALEGNIAKSAIMDGLSRGLRPGGDMIPWVVAQQFQEGRFAEMSGARIVRVAVDPECLSMGYGSRALKALNEYYSGEILSLEETEGDSLLKQIVRKDDEISLLTDAPTIRSPATMPPLLQRLSERKPESLDYLGVSYGLTPQLLRFWKRGGFVPLYLRQTTNDLTGEHSCVMVRGLNSSVQSELGWLGEFASDFRSRFITLLSYPRFRDFGCVTALSILEAVNACEGVKELDAKGDNSKALTPALLPSVVSPFDLKRLESYGNNMLDYHVILDLLSVIAGLFFQRRLAAVTPTSESEKPENIHLSAVQSAILLGVGLQRKSVEDIETELSLPVSQILALLVKVVRKITKRLVDIQKQAISQDMERPAPTVVSSAEPAATKWTPLEKSVEDELDEAGEEEMSTIQQRERQRELIDSLDLKKYAIDDGSMDWTAAEGQVARIGAKKGVQSVVSIKANGDRGIKRKAEDSSGAAGNTKKPTRRSSGKKAKR
ncbi:GNAT acetyltransferase 2-domain-containing protein [Mycena floridula]|nr:GNAT acetyltransferase 2-domain-containing protein [Mycena floridula]